MNAETLIRETLAYIDKSLDNVADLDVVWENAEVVEVLEDVRSLLVTGEINPGSFEKAQAPTDDEREALSNFLFSVYEHGSQPNALREADAILSFLASRRPAQGEPTGDVRQTCAWCPGDARGSAWWNDGRLHPSCGQIGHGEGWVPDERAVRPAQGDYFEGFEEGVTVGRGTPAQTEPTDAQIEASAIALWLQDALVNAKAVLPWPEISEGTREGWRGMARAALRAAFTAGQEDKP